MQVYDWFVATVAAVGVIAFAISWTPLGARLALAQLTIARGLPLPTSIRRSVVSRMLTQMRFAIALGLVAYVGTHLILRASGYPYTLRDLYLCLAMLGLATAVAIVIAASGQQLSRPATTVRLARLRTTTLDDYIPVAHRVVAWITVSCVAVSVVANDLGLAVVGAAAPTPPQLFPIVITNLIAAFTLAGMVIFEVAGRAIVARPQPAGSSEELVWDDVLRASALRELIQAPVVVGAYAFIWAILRGQNWNYGGFSILAFALIAPVIAGFFVTQWMLRDSREHFLRRLWPTGPSADDPGADAVAAGSAAPA